MNRKGQIMNDTTNAIGNYERRCKGVVFKADVQHCRTKRGIMFSVRLNQIKSLSCPGCSKCGWVWDDLDNISSDYAIQGIESAEHGGLYILGGS